MIEDGEFSYDETITRDNTSLDITCVEDKSFALDNLIEPGCITEVVVLK